MISCDFFSKIHTARLTRKPSPWYRPVIQIKNWLQKEPPVSAIRQALIVLDQAVTELESTANTFETTPPGGQRDMFPETKRQVVKSLDTMIAHVETMLEEA